MGYRIKFWDALNADVEDAHEHEWDAGTPDDGDVEMILSIHAERDNDGWNEGLYHDYRMNQPSPQPYIVQHPDGRQEEWEVYAEMSPVFHASKVKGNGDD